VEAARQPQQVQPSQLSAACHLEPAAAMQGGNRHIYTNARGQTLEPLFVRLLLLKGIATLGAAGACVWAGLRPRESQWVRSALSAAGVLVALPLIGNAVGSFTLALEAYRRNKAERLTWQLCERSIYAEARLMATTTAADGSPGSRRVCVVQHNEDCVDKPTLLFVHGSMASLAQFEAPIAFFRKVSYLWQRAELFLLFFCRRSLLQQLLSPVALCRGASAASQVLLLMCACCSWVKQARVPVLTPRFAKHTVVTLTHARSGRAAHDSSMTFTLHGALGCY
jgi:hypothetical protein